VPASKLMNAHTCTISFTHSKKKKKINRYITAYKSHTLAQNSHV